MGLLLQGSVEDAEQPALEALAVREQLFGTQSPESRGYVAYACKHREQWQRRYRPSTCFVSARVYIYSHTFGADDLRTAYAANSIGVVYWTRARYEDRSNTIGSP